MTSQQILQTDLLDILFEKRNKLYGAYQLRRMYQQQLVKALTLAIGSAFVLLLFFKPANVATRVEEEKGTVVEVDQIVPLEQQKKVEPPKLPQASKPPQVRQQTFVDNIVITEKEISHPLPPQVAFDHAAVSDRTADGDDVAGQLPVMTESKDNGTGNGQPEPQEKKEIKPDRQPQFPGGMQAWLLFLERNLHVPEELESGEKRTALVRFHVAEDGSITRFQVVQSAGSAFDNEVIRVLKKMPKWTPAMQAGQPVAVSFTQPVTFLGLEN